MFCAVTVDLQTYWLMVYGLNVSIIGPVYVPEMSGSVLLAMSGMSNIHSFIHTEHLYSASSRELLRGAPDSSTAKKSSLCNCSFRRMLPGHYTHQDVAEPVPNLEKRGW